MKDLRPLLIDCRIELRKLARDFQKTELCERLDLAIQQVANANLGPTAAPAPTVHQPLDGLTKTGAGTLLLSGANTYTGNTSALNFGWLKLNGDASVSSSSSLRANGNSVITLQSDQTVGSLFGQPGRTLAALMLALMVPTVNVLSVWSLTAERGVSARSLLLPILKNPLILACLGGALVNLSGLGLPGGSDRLLSLLAAASLPLGLLCVGAALKPEQLGGEIPALGWNSLLRLLGMPMLAWAVAYSLQLPAMESTVLVLFFALPTAPTAYVLTRQLGGDSQLMAGIITLQTLLAAASLPLLLLLVVG